MVHVIGGGAAGMAAALFAARAGAKVTLLERNEKLGKKLYITGKGRCNVTNTAENLLEHIPRNPRFLHAAFAFFPPEALRELLAAQGCPTKEERGGRVFPESDKASDVTRALEKALHAAGVQVRLNARVESLEPLLAQGAVVLATGGASYPATGSTGDGYRFAREAGHTVHPPRPSLVPLITKEQWPTTLSGLSLQNVRLSARAGGKQRFDALGEMLFTHFGLSGPLVLAMSSHILDDDLSALDVRLDMKPGLTPEQLDARLQRDFAAEPRKQLVTLLPKLLPARLAALMPGLAGIDGGKSAHQITREERH
ncbi:MAG: NAD(P)/FAD-dependent oxidoreductase, partial [Oscillospiraceae bacterium]|nr:NAD(P)/FAD-dependent oxidoreductase [Oscillospiraceae bacterium]